MSWSIRPTANLPDDVDAIAYIAAVEVADAEPLELGVKRSINAFVKGCKADGIWDAIKASCIMAGARTLAGALVPLKGTAPTNFNFVSGDYNRKTGLVGDGSTKYLDSNRNNDDDPQDNQHLSCFITTYPAGFNSALMGSGVFSDSGNSYLLRGAYIGVKSQTGGSVAITGPNSDPVGLFGVSRNNNSNFSYRLIGVNNLASFASVTPRFNGNTLVFARGTTVSLDQPTNARLAFYSIGESLDLALLDARVTTLINNINDALTWGWAMTITIADTTHTLRLNAACTFVVDWGDGTRETLTSTTNWTYTKTYAAPGTYRLRFSIQSGTFYPYYNNVTADAAELRTLEGTGPEAWSFGSSLSGAFFSATGLTEVSGGMNTAGVTDFSAAWLQCSSLTSFPQLDVSSGTSFSNAWQACTSLTSFPQLDVSSGTNFAAAWYQCSSLTSFPQLDVSSGTSFYVAWFGCTSLTSFPQLDVSSGTNFWAAWYGCSFLTSFPQLDVSSGTTFLSAWFQCSSLTSFPVLNVSSGTNFQSAWQQCTSLTSFPPLDVSSGIDFTFAWWECSSLTSFPLLDVSSGTNFLAAWRGCTSLTSFPRLDVSSGIIFQGAWYLCTSLTSFPQLDVSSGTNFQDVWYGCTSLTSFPLLDVSSGTTFVFAWYGCTSLTSFPQLDVSSGTNFLAAWQLCTSLTSFPQLDVSSGTNFQGAWYLCTSLTSFPANFFDVTGTLTSTAFTDAFFGCALTAASIENILTSLVTNGQFNIALTLSGGTNAGADTWTPAAVAAYYTLIIERGWTISFNGTLSIYETDAQAYITAVEEADDQALEAATKDAINTFVVGCKLDGTWDAIKASCIMAGARTLAGALVPLKGDAPTNVNSNFVSGDYNRKTGLKGDGTTKYLDSGRNNNADPQNNKHLAVWISTHHTRNQVRADIGMGGINNGSSQLATSTTSRLSRINFTSDPGVSDVSTATGFWGASRASSSSIFGRHAGATITINNTSTTPFVGNVRVFDRSQNPSDARLAFYSIGESLDLALLDARVTTLINNINDVLTWGWAMTITIADTTHTLRLNAACTFIVDWGDGTRDTLTSTTAWTYTKTYAAPGTYRLRFSIQSGTFSPYYNNVTADVAELRTLEGTGPEAWSFGSSLNAAFYGASGLTEVGGMNTAGVTSFFRTWRQCTSLTSFPLLDVSSVTTFQDAWDQCSSLTSFPLLDVSSGRIFDYAWRQCTSLTSFPQLDVSSGTSFGSAWGQCSSLTSFPPLDVSSGINFTYAWLLCSSLTSFPQLDVSSGTSFQSAWQSCTSLTSFPPLDVSSGTNFTSAWQSCTSLTSFPQLDVSSGTSFYAAWQLCTSLTSFPLLDVSSGINFQSAWRQCSSLTSFPQLDVSSGINFSYVWTDCASLTSFPSLDVSLGIMFDYAWFRCLSLTSFPANFFDVTGTLNSTAFNNAFGNCALTAASIENILTSLVTNGQSNIVLHLHGGANAGAATWTPAAIAAYDTLTNDRNWTITRNA